LQASRLSGTKAGGWSGEPATANPADALDVVTFGQHGDETSPDGVPYRWMAGPRVQIVVRRTAREILVPLRHEAGAFGEPTEARIDVDGRRRDLLRLENGDWRMSQLPLVPHGVPRFGRMHRLSVTIDRAWGARGDDSRVHGHPRARATDRHDRSFTGVSRPRTRH
jgi:hypothetical protein